MFARFLLLGLAGCPIGWKPDAAEMTFPLVGRHEPLACAACHPAAAPIGALSTACASCHEAARPPSHSPDDCGGCHTAYGWDDVVVDHSFFPLTDAHAQPCASCHADGSYAGLDPACASCHESARPAGHFGAQDCGDCHVPTTWSDADFDHDPLFPLPHEGVSDCASCHLTADYTATPSCTSCHAHSRAEADDEHLGEVAGYEYKDEACIRCHPTGREEDR